MNGLIEQWGDTSVSSSSSMQYKTQNLPLSFSTDYSLTLTSFPTSGTNYICAINSQALSSFSIAYNYCTDKVNWIAIGY